MVAFAHFIFHPFIHFPWNPEQGSQKFHRSLKGCSPFSPSESGLKLIIFTRVEGKEDRCNGSNGNIFSCSNSSCSENKLRSELIGKAIESNTNTSMLNKICQLNLVRLRNIFTLLLTFPSFKIFSAVFSFFRRSA